MRTAITTRPVEEAPLIALRESLIVVSDHYAQHREQHVRRARLAETGAALADYQRAVLVPQWEEMLAEAVATRLSVQVDVDVRPRLLAGVAIAVMSSVGAAWMASNGAGDLEEMYRQAYATLNEAVVQSIGAG